MVIERYLLEGKVEVVVGGMNLIQRSDADILVTGVAWPLPFLSTVKADFGNVMSELVVSKRKTASSPTKPDWRVQLGEFSQPRFAIIWLSPEEQMKTKSFLSII